MSNYLNSEGTFECVVYKPEGGWIQKSKEKQTPFICLSLEVTGDDVDAGKTISWNGWLSDKAFDKTIDRLIEVFGFNGDLNALDTLEGKTCQITTESETYEGKTRVKVKWLNKAGYVHTVPQMDAVESARLIAQFSGRAKKRALAVQSGQAAKPSTSPAASQPEDDDVPF